MTDRLFIKAAPGLSVPDPASGQLVPAEGIEVERNTYWIRRIADGDVLLVEPPKTKSTPAPRA